MNVREKVLRELKDGSVSGGKLASALGISRNAVWKAVDSLRAQGYVIQGCPSKGYRLESAPEVLSEAAIRAGIKAENPRIFLYSSIDSTDSQAKRLLADGLEGLALLAANEQTAGRGRRGRSFFSPAGTGVYMTLVLRPEAKLSEAASLTTAAAVAVTRAIEKLTGRQVQIKWVNDLYLDGRKICGILTEAVTDFESGAVQSVLVGVGVNLHKQEFPETLSQSAASLDSTIDRNSMIAAIADEVFTLYSDLSDKRYISDYHAHSMVIGKHVNYYEGTQMYSAFAVDINENGALLVRHADGSMKTLSGGEITLRVV